MGINGMIENYSSFCRLILCNNLTALLHASCILVRKTPASDRDQRSSWQYDKNPPKSNEKPSDFGDSVLLIFSVGIFCNKPRFQTPGKTHIRFKATDQTVKRCRFVKYVNCTEAIH